MSRKVRLGTRGSKLALAQATTVKLLIEELVPTVEVEIVTIRTSGDRGDREVTGAFVREIQSGLLEGEVDIGLHCLKDLPTQSVAGLAFAAHLPRGDARDTLITRSDSNSRILEGAIIGTGSVRRTSQLAATRPDLQFRPLVGNVDTRLGKLQSGEYDGIILAIAGLERLGLLEDWSGSKYADLKVTPFSAKEMLPAPGQAVLVLETRDNSQDKLWLANLDHEATRISSTAERAFLARFGGGCSVPVAALGSWSNGMLQLQGLVATPDGKTVLRASAEGSSADEVADTVFNEIAERGGLDLFPRAVGAR